MYFDADGNPVAFSKGQYRIRHSGMLLLVLPKWCSVLLGAYVVFILYETLMFREIRDARINLVLFSYAGKFLKEQSVRVGVINNICCLFHWG